MEGGSFLCLYLQRGKEVFFFRVGEMSRCVVFPSPCFMGKWGAESENPSSPVLLIFMSLSNGKDRDSMKKLIPLKNILEMWPSPYF